MPEDVMSQPLRLSGIVEESIVDGRGCDMCFLPRAVPIAAGVAIIRKRTALRAAFFLQQRLLLSSLMEIRCLRG